MHSAETMLSACRDPQICGLPCKCGCHSSNRWIEPCLHCAPKGCAGWRWGSLRINAGSGQRPFADGFINIDIQQKWNPDIVTDCSSMPMFADGSAELIVSHHSLEHARCGEGAPMLLEGNRILKSGGSLIICVPDMRALAHAWIQGRIDTQIYMTNVYGAYNGSPVDQHAWGYDAESLKRFLLTCGFSRVKPFDWREIPGADISKDFWILAVEAVK